MLKSHALLVRDLLRKARSIGHVAIVTLGKRQWVQFTASTFLPGVDWEEEFRELGIQVVYARETLPRLVACHQLEEEGVDLFVRSKTQAMAKALRSFRRQAGVNATATTCNLLSFGDSRVEAEAVQELAWRGAGGGAGPCKAVKLRDAPATIEELTSQLQELMTLIRPIALTAEDLDLTLEAVTCHDTIVREDLAFSSVVKGSVEKVLCRPYPHLLRVGLGKEGK
jgi:hypothetical protein